MDYFGQAVGAAGDVDGDGFDDVVIGAPLVGLVGHGAAYIFAGSCAVHWFLDADGDGFGDVSAMNTLCDQPAGYVADNTDCGYADGYANGRPRPRPRSGGLRLQYRTQQRLVVVDDVRPGYRAVSTLYQPTSNRRQ